MKIYKISRATKNDKRSWYFSNLKKAVEYFNGTPAEYHRIYRIVRNLEFGESGIIYIQDNKKLFAVFYISKHEVI